MAQLIVFETTGRWANHLRAAAPQWAPRIRETRTWDDCWEALRQCPNAFLVLEATERRLGELLRRLVQLQRRWPNAAAAAVASRSLASSEWALREAGAVHVACSPRRIDRIVRLAARHLAQSPTARLDWPERVRARMPWPPPLHDDRRSEP